MSNKKVNTGGERRCKGGEWPVIVYIRRSPKTKHGLARSLPLFSVIPVFLWAFCFLFLGLFLKICNQGWIVERFYVSFCYELYSLRCLLGYQQRYHI
jgi:hypothetical protein